MEAETLLADDGGSHWFCRAEYAAGCRKVVAPRSLAARRFLVASTARFVGRRTRFRMFQRANASSTRSTSSAPGVRSCHPSVY